MLSTNKIKSETIQEHRIQFLEKNWCSEWQLAALDTPWFS